MIKINYVDDVDVLLAHVGLPRVLHVVVLLDFYAGWVEGIIQSVLLFWFLCGTPPSWLQFMGGGW